ncbi:hypothetical protein RUM43_005300 [Polyplax serrata]|uniref:Uncharacterized protein n=1 Tax=Polyplax serrata TaxID=468196 RepID=A0AAN8NWH1_POLSC
MPKLTPCGALQQTIIERILKNLLAHVAELWNLLVYCAIQIYDGIQELSLSGTQKYLKYNFKYENTVLYFTTAVIIVENGLFAFLAIKAESSM